MEGFSKVIFWVVSAILNLSERLMFKCIQKREKSAWTQLRSINQTERTDVSSVFVARLNEQSVETLVKKKERGKRQT